MGLATRLVCLVLLGALVVLLIANSLLLVPRSMTQLQPPAADEYPPNEIPLPHLSANYSLHAQDDDPFGSYEDDPTHGRKYDTSFAARFKHGQYEASCVYPCMRSGPIAFSLGDDDSCLKGATCHFYRYRFKAFKSTKVQCKSRSLALCPTPYTTDCSLYSYNNWNVTLQTKHSSVSRYYSLLVVSESRPFKVLSILPLANPYYFLVVAYYLPVYTRKDRCNQIYCVYESQGGEIQEYKAYLGDFTFAFCPRPSLPLNTNTTLRLTYDHRVFSFPRPLRITRVDHDLPVVDLSICTMVRMEGINLREWIEYHSLVGVSRFIIYDNNQKPDSKMDRILQDYSDRVVVVKWRPRHSQAAGLTDCIHRFGRQTKWFALIDVDEFIVPRLPYTDIVQPLKDRYHSQSYLLPRWVTFGPCQTEGRRQGQLIIEICRNTTKVKGNKSMTKPIFRPSYVSGMYGFSPHEVRLTTTIGMPKSVKSGLPTKDVLDIYHYRYRTWPEFRERRLGDTAARTLHRSENDVKDMWKAAVKGVHYFPDSDNQILRFLSQVKEGIKNTVKKHLRN